MKEIETAEDDFRKKNPSGFMNMAALKDTFSVPDSVIKSVFKFCDTDTDGYLTFKDIIGRVVPLLSGDVGLSVDCSLFSIPHTHDYISIDCLDRWSD